MDKTMIITLFSSLYPCWDEEMLASEGASVRDAAELAAKGLLCADGCIYSLTKAGRWSFGALRRRILSTTSQARLLPYTAHPVRRMEACGCCRV